MRCSVSDSDSDEYMEDSSEREDQEGTPSQTPSTNRARGRTLRKHASSSTITLTSFSNTTATPNLEEASHPIPHSLNFSASIYHPDTAYSLPFPRRTTLDRLVYATDDTPSYLSNSTESNSSVATLQGQENVWNNVGLYLPSNEPSSSSRVTMAWGAHPDSVATYRSFSPVQEAHFVRLGPASGFSTATVEQNPTYGTISTPSMPPSPQQLFGSHAGGSDSIPFDSSLWADGTFEFQAGRELFVQPKQELSVRKDSMHIALVDEGSIPAAPTPQYRSSLLGVASPAPAPSPASSVASSGCSAGSRSIAPSMLSLSPPAPQPSSFLPSTVAGQTRERGRAHARTTSLPTEGGPVGSQRKRRNALYTLSVSPPNRSSTFVLPPVPALYDPLGPEANPCLQQRPSSITASESLCSSISPAPSAMEHTPASQPGVTSGTHPLSTAPNGPSAYPYYTHAGLRNQTMDLTSSRAAPSAPRMDKPLYDPPPGPPPPSRQCWQSRSDAPPYPPAYHT
jgi:hypothetical protein